MTTYAVASELVTFSAQAPAAIAGTTARRWYVADETGRKVASGLPTEADAVVRMAERIAGETPIVVRFADGSSRTMAAATADLVVGIDAEGDVVAKSDGLLYLLTPCCNASGKGYPVESGVVCRSCYVEVDTAYGVPATVAVARA